MKDNYFKSMCHGICEAKQLDAAILLTVKADREKDTAAIELHGDGPNKQAVQRMKEIISTALSESIEQFKAEKAKQEEQAKKSGVSEKDMEEESNDRRNAKLLLGMLKRIDSEMEMFWRASVMARGGRVDNSRWAGLQMEMDNARRIMARVEWENAETGK